MWTCVMNVMMFTVAMLVTDTTRGSTVGHIRMDLSPPSAALAYVA
jgi:hypothetical protein